MAISSRLGGAIRQTVFGMLSGQARGALPAVYASIRNLSSSKLFIGGLSFNTEEDSLRSAFSSHGDIQEVRIITDRDTGRSRGFGFVTYSSETDAGAALEEMNGKILDGRSIRVDYASPQPPRSGGGGGFGGDGGFGRQSGFDSGYSDGGSRFSSGGGGFSSGGGGFGRRSGFDSDEGDSFSTGPSRSSRDFD